MGAVMPAGTARVVACRASSKERAGRSGQPRTWPLDPAPVRSDSAPFQPPAAVREVSPAAANGELLWTWVLAACPGSATRPRSSAAMKHDAAPAGGVTPNE